MGLSRVAARIVGCKQGGDSWASRAGTDWGVAGRSTVGSNARSTGELHIPDQIAPGIGRDSAAAPTRQTGKTPTAYKSPPPTASYYYYYRARPPRTETAAIGETFSQYITFLKSVHISYCYRILSRRGAAKRCLIGTNPAPSCAVFFIHGGRRGGGV